MVTIDVGVAVAALAAVMAVLSGVALVEASKRGTAVLAGTLLSIAGVWAYWAGSYASIIADWWR